MSLLFFNLFDSLLHFNLSTEERIGNILENKDISYIEFENGYLCIYFDYLNDNECMFVSYLKHNFFGSEDLNLRGLIGNNYNYYLNNTNLKRIYTLPLNNFSKHTIYFSCCEKEYAIPIKINGQKIDLYDIELKRENESIIRTFWFYFGEDGVYPQVT